MQTFLISNNFIETAKCLDNKRLGKQRVECKVILSILLGLTKSKAWINHPAILMWKGYEYGLWIYSVMICEEWIKRGFKDSILSWLNGGESYEIITKTYDSGIDNKFPPWLGDKNFHDSHKSNLLRKNKEYYSKFGCDVPYDLEYVWPTKIKQ